MTLADYIAKQVLAQLTSAATVSPQLQDRQEENAQKDKELALQKYQKTFSHSVSYSFFVQALTQKHGVDLMRELRQKYASREILEQEEPKLMRQLIEGDWSSVEFEELQVKTYETRNALTLDEILSNKKVLEQAPLVPQLEEKLEKNRENWKNGKPAAVRAQKDLDKIKTELTANVKAIFRQLWKWAST